VYHERDCQQSFDPLYLVVSRLNRENDDPGGSAVRGLVTLRMGMKLSTQGLNCDPLRLVNEDLERTDELISAMSF
jgi:hypothetical protein